MNSDDFFQSPVLHRCYPTESSGSSFFFNEEEYEKHHFFIRVSFVLLSVDEHNNNRLIPNSNIAMDYSHQTGSINYERSVARIQFVRGVDAPVRALLL